MDIAILIDEVIAREGGYSNHPADRGGPTNWGITQGIARANGYAGDMRALPRSLAEKLYRRLYWDQPGYAFVAESCPAVATELFDTAVNMGAGRPPPVSSSVRSMPSTVTRRIIPTFGSTAASAPRPWPRSAPSSRCAARRARPCC